MARPRKFDRSEALDKAMLVFWQKGYEATFLDDLTQAMGINRPSLYNAFGDKHALYMEALARYREMYSGKMLATLARAPNVRAGFGRIFDDLIAGATERCAGCMIVNSTVQTCATSEGVAAFVKETDAASKRAFTVSLTDARRRGEISGDPQALASYLYSAIAGLQLRAKAGDSRAELGAVAELALSVLD